MRVALLDTAERLMRDMNASSLHALFVEDDEREFLCARGFAARLDCQFHWQNLGFAAFDDFLGTFTAEKRKKARRERRRVAESGIRFRELHGGDLDADPVLLETVYALHARTFAERGNPPYFTLEFFRDLAAALPDVLMVPNQKRKSAMEYVSSAKGVNNFSTFQFRHMNLAMMAVLINEHRLFATCQCDESRAEF